MSLAAITAAATALAAAEEKTRKGAIPGRARTHSLLSESTDGDTDPFESDSSNGALAAGDVERDDARAGSSKKRRAETVAKPELKKKLAAMESDCFPAEMLLDLAGSTSAEVRRMNDDERALVHYKRRLRNRESAKRSRARRQATISDIQGELEELRDVTASLVDRCVNFTRINERQGQELETLRKEKQLLESMLRGGSVL